jgi:N-acetyl-alpha-D-muramate 1-phosphate uridylyltransferase
MSRSVQWKPEVGMVLGAGLGTRMRPLTDRIPQPLVRLKERALIDHVLDRIAAAGVTRAVVNVHHHADAMETHLRHRKHPKIEISDERGVLLDTGGGVVRALPKLGSGPFLIHNSDSVWIEGVGSNLERMFASWDSGTMDSLMLLASGATSLGYEGSGDFAMGTDGRLSRRGERQMVPFVFTGVSIAHPRMFVNAPEGRFSLNKPWDEAIDKGRLFGIRLEGLWMHVGTPEALTEAERWIESEDVA